VAILCRVPYADGALTPAFNAQARGASTAAPRPPAVACAWRKVATEFGATGWVPALDLCG
jgi:hypothetical protein